MKLLLVSPLQENTNGGIAVWTKIFVDAAKDAGIEPTVLNTAAVGKRLENGSAKRNFFDEVKRTRRIFRDLKALLKKQTYDVAHINTSCGRFGIIRDYMTAKKIRRKQPNTRIIVHYNCDIPYQIRTKRSFKYLKKLLEVSDESMVLCDTSLEYLNERFGVVGTKVPNFIDEKYIANESKAIRDVVEEILFVGRVSRAKGALELFEVAKNFPSIRFSLIGSVDSKICTDNLPENISLLGQCDHDEVIEAMDRADLFFLPTHSEGFSLALLEAMARGLPAITTDVGANADMMSGGCGAVVPVGDVSGMREKIESFLSADSRSEASQIARCKVTNEYTMSKVVDIIKSCYSRGLG